MIRFCPFPPCAAALHMAVERAAPGPQPDAVVRYPEHQVAVPGLPVQLCPASLMAFPLGPVEVAHLVAASDELERQLNDQAARQVDEPAVERRRPRVGESDWFRWTGNNQADQRGGYVAPPVMPQVLMPEHDEKGFQ